jgi:hypothetical protein
MTRRMPPYVSDNRKRLLYATQIGEQLFVLDAHEMTMEMLEGSVQIGATWTLPDGRVWMGEVRGEG